MPGESAPETFRVAVLGANGQVGTELCLYLKVMGFCKPIAIARSPHSTALLMRAGVECRWGDLASPEVAGRLLKDCDLIFDLALPNGKNLRETRRMMRARAVSIFSVARPARGFILASTTAVYRYHVALPFFRAYRSMKLYSERVSRSLGSKNGVSVFIFRLGEVHGELQACSNNLRQQLSRNGRRVHVPDQPSNAVFVFSIAEAIKAVLNRDAAPNTYTVISHPAWTFAELIHRYAEQVGANAKLKVETARMGSSMGQRFSAVRTWLMQGPSRLVSHNKELLSAITSTYSEELDQKLRFMRTRRIAAATISAYFDSLIYRPFEVLIDPPGLRFPFASDSRTAMLQPESRVSDLIRRLNG